MSPEIVALVPARGGSRRVPKKNVRYLNGAPLLAYALATAHEAGIFGAVAVSSDDEETLAIAEQYGASHLILRPAEYAQDDSPDIQWVNHAMESFSHVDAFCILRPTSPFRRGAWVAQAWSEFQSWSDSDSLRAMRPVSEHPGKMWRIHGKRTAPIFPFDLQRTPWHSSPTQQLPGVYIQTAALEIAWSRVLLDEPPSISGDVVMPWVCEPDAPESIDINSETDWRRAKDEAIRHPQWLPKVEKVVRI